jgi:hypothetical protein
MFQVFKPPCPWTMGLMNLLAELNADPDLKRTLKFEIEVTTVPQFYSSASVLLFSY